MGRSNQYHTGEILVLAVVGNVQQKVIGKASARPLLLGDGVAVSNLSPADGACPAIGSQPMAPT